MFTLGFTAWLAVFREGAEVILFYQPMLSEGHPDMVWAGFGVGCLVLVFVFLFIRFLSVKLPLKPFFLATSILMSVMTVCFLGSGIKELMEGGVLDNFEWAIYSPSWLSWIPYNDVLDVLLRDPAARSHFPLHEREHRVAAPERHAAYRRKSFI